MTDKSDMEEEENNKYTITLTEEQLQNIAEALEFTSRFACGQIGQTYFPSGLKGILWKKHKDNWTEHTNHTEAASYIMKLALHPELSMHGQYGIGHFEYVDSIYDMYKKIWHVLWGDRGGNEWSVHSTFHPTTSDEPMEIKKVEE
jgi:hypothetical protein